MKTYIAILRGINVSGHNIIKMDELKTSLHSLNLINIETYIQSGNIVFDYDNTNQDKLIFMLENNIRQTFGIDVTLIIRSAEQMTKIFKNNPFINTRNEDVNKLHVTFFSKSPDQEVLMNILNNTFLPDEFIVNDDIAYLFCPNGYGNTKINNSFFEKKLKVSATTRNWKTVSQLMLMAQNR